MLLLQDPVIIIATVLGCWDPLGPLGFGWTVEVTIVHAGGVKGVINNRNVVLLIPLLLDGALGSTQFFQVNVIDLLWVHHQGIITGGILLTLIQVIEVKLVVVIFRVHGSSWGFLCLILLRHVVV